MTAPLQLKKAFIGMQMLKSDYEKVKGLLPTPSYKSYPQSTCKAETISIIFEINHILHTSKQYQWLSDIKIIWEKNIIVKFEYINEFYLNEYILSSGAIYSLLELSSVFKSEYIEYPKPFYPATPKELYKKLVWYAIKVYKKDLLTFEIVYATALRMNSNLEKTEHLKERELYKKAYMAYSFIIKNEERFYKKSKNEVKTLNIKGGKMRGNQKKQERLKNIERIKEILPHHLKPNDKPNITSIAKELKLSRVTVANAIKTFFMFLLIIWFRHSLDFEVQSYEFLESTNIPTANFTLFTKPKIKGFREGIKSQKAVKV